MTVVAYRNGIMASDGRSVSGWTITSDRVEKIVRLPDGSLAGFCGQLAIGQRYVKWLEKQEGDRPALHNTSDPKESATTILVAKMDGILELHTVGGTESVQAEFWAIGCGQDIALGAMEMGASAIEAVKAAIRRNMGCGGEVRHMEIECDLRWRR